MPLHSYISHHGRLQMFEYLDLILLALNILTGYFGYRKGKQNIPEAAAMSRELSEFLCKAAADRKITASELKSISKKVEDLNNKLQG